MSAQPHLVANRGPLTIRRAEPRDADACGRICYQAFITVADRFGHPREFPAEEVGLWVIGTLFNNPGFYCVVAEADGKIVGSNCLDERNPISGIGPITVDPAVQDAGIGRQLMKAVMDRNQERGFAGVRLVQAGYHMRSLSLYTKLGFITREQLVVFQGTPQNVKRSGYTVRPLTEADLPACNDLCFAVHGHDRAGELRDAIVAQGAFVAERDGGIRAYTSGLGYFGHTVGESNEAVAALLGEAPWMQSPGVHVPTRNAFLFRWCLEHGLRAQQTNTLMTIGVYNEPAGAWLPSILY